MEVDHLLLHELVKCDHDEWEYVCHFHQVSLQVQYTQYQIHKYDHYNRSAKGIGGIVGALMQTVEVGDTTEHKKLKNLLSGNYGQSASLTSNAESLLGAFAQEVAQSMGVYNQAMMASSSYGGSYDSSYVDEESGEEASSTIVPGTTDPNYYEAYDAAVDSRMKAKWKTAIDNAQSEWSKRTRGGKNPTFIPTKVHRIIG